MDNLFTPETMNTMYLVLGVAVAWIVLRFIIKITKKIFAIGCLAILVIGGVLFIMQSIGGA